MEATLPRTKLWADEGGNGWVIVLECVCGTAVEYPGHPDERTSFTCEACGKIWTVEL